MRYWIYFLIIIGCGYLSIISCQKEEVQEMTNDNSVYAGKGTPIEGAWVLYEPDGEWGQAMELYDFYPDMRFRIVVGVLPDKNSTNMLPTGLSMDGTYALKEDTVFFKTSSGAEKSRKFEIQDKQLFFKDEYDKISILRRVEKMASGWKDSTMDVH